MDNIKNHYNSRSWDEKASSFRRSIAAELSGLADALAEQRYQRGFLPLVMLKDCIQYFKDEVQKLAGTADVSGFILSVKKNLDSRNENDNYVVVQGLVDSQNKPISINGKSVSRIMHTRTIDDALVRALNGKESCLFRD